MANDNKQRTHLLFLTAICGLGGLLYGIDIGACTAAYFITATFFLPETKGKSLEEIERLFAAPKARAKEQHG